MSLKTDFRMGFIAVVILVLVNPANSEIDTSVIVLDLKQTVRYAIDHSPEFDSIKKRLEIADLEEKTAFYRYFPSLDLSAVHGLDESDPRPVVVNAGYPWTSRATLSLTQNLYDNGETNAKHKIAELTKEQATLSFNEQKNKLSLDVISLFLAYSLNAKLVEIQEKQFSMMTRQYQSVSKDYYQGFKTKRDFLRFKTQVNRIEIGLSTAKSNLEKSRLALLKQLGESDENSAQFRFTAVDLESYKDIQTISGIDIKKHYLYRFANLQKEINDLNYGLIHQKKWPEIYLTASASYGSSQYIQSHQSFSDNDVVSWNALLTLKYNFFDGGIRSRDADVAYLKRQILNNDLQVSLFSIQTVIKELQMSTQQTVRNYNLANDLLKLEKDNLGFMQSEYRSGKVQYLDLIAGYDNLADAEIKFFTASSELEIVKYTALYHQGKLYEEILK